MGFAVRTCATAGAVLLAVASFLSAQETASDAGAVPTSLTAVFGDWTARCGASGDGVSDLLCEAAQFVHLPEQPRPVAQIMVRQKDDGFEMVIEVAPDILLPGEVTVSFGDGIPPFMLGWQRCLPAACIAAGAPPPDALRTWMQQPVGGTFTYPNARGAVLEYPLSPVGLAQAIKGIPLE